MATSARSRHESEALLPGWVARKYPVVLETWPQLSAVARVAAQVLFSECEPGQIVEIRHADFCARLPASEETGSRHAFARLEAAGLVRCVYRTRGRHGRTLYRLADPIEVHRRRGLGLAASDPQLLLPFAIEAVRGEEDLGGGMLRLWTRDESGNSAGLSGKQSGRSAGLTADESGNSAGLNPPVAREQVGRTGSQSAEVVGNTEVAAAVSRGIVGSHVGHVRPTRFPTFCVAALQESQDQDLFLVKVKESISGLTPAARAVWEQLRAKLAASDWDSYLARCLTESDQDGSGLVIVAPDEWSAERIRRLLRGSGLLAGVTIRSGPAEPSCTGNGVGRATAAADNGRVWSLRIRQAIQDCGGRDDTAWPASAVNEAARYLAERRLPAKRVDRLLEKVRQRRPRNPGAWLNTCFAELCAQCGLPWRESGTGSGTANTVGPATTGGVRRPR